MKLAKILKIQDPFRSSQGMNRIESRVGKVRAKRYLFYIVK